LPTPKKPGAIRKQKKALVDRRDELERKAGVHQLAKDARDSPFSHLLRDLPARERNQAERSGAEHTRRRIRDIYFSIIDSDLRCKLIAVDRKLYLNWLQRKEYFREAEGKVSEAKLEKDREPWKMVVLIGGGAVAIGYFVAGPIGSIGGAVVGFFLGLGVFPLAKFAARNAVQYAERGLNEIEESWEEAPSMPPNFAVDEELSGERNGSFDRGF